MQNLAISSTLVFFLSFACSGAPDEVGAPDPQSGEAVEAGAVGGAPAAGEVAKGGAQPAATATSSTATPAATGSAARATTPASVRLPPANAAFDYQLGGAYTPPKGVTVVSRDRSDKPAVGLYNICYVNGFQTQPDEETFWKNEHPDLLLRDKAGRIVIDAAWGEMLLDTSTEAKRLALASIVGGWITQCAKDGFDAVEIDNLDTYSRSSDRLTKANNVAFVKRLADIAHGAGLAIAQKNSTELLSSAKEMATDFAVAEECNRWGECGDYQEVYGNLVYVIEYRQQDFDAGCKAHPELSIVLRDLNVSPAGKKKYVFRGC